MGEANPISRLKSPPSAITPTGPLAVEVEPLSKLSYWQQNLRAVADRTSAELAIWMKEDTGSEADCQLSVWGSVPSLLESRLLGSGNRETTRHHFLLRFIAPEALTNEALERIAQAEPDRLFLIQRAVTSLDRLGALDLSPPAHDPNLALRRIHIHTAYKLCRQKQFARRGITLHLAEFGLHEAGDV